MQKVMEGPVMLYCSIGCRTGQVTYGSDEIRRHSEVFSMYSRPAYAVAGFMTKLHLRIMRVFRS